MFQKESAIILENVPIDIPKLTNIRSWTLTELSKRGKVFLRVQVQYLLIVTVYPYTM